MSAASYEVRYDPAALAALDEAASYIEEQSGSERARIVYVIDIVHTARETRLAAYRNQR